MLRCPGAACPPKLTSLPYLSAPTDTSHIIDRFEMTAAPHSSRNQCATEKPTISVRQFIPTDEAAIAKLFHEVMLTRYTDPSSEIHLPWREYAKKRLRTDLADIHGTYIATGGNFWVAVATDSAGEERIAGIIGLDRKSEAVGEVRSVFVSVDHHRLGVGRSLMSTLQQWAKENRLQRLFLTTTAENQQSRGFYESMGFEHHPHDPPMLMLGLIELAEYVQQL